MENGNRNDQHVKALQRLLSIVDEQGKTEYAEALQAGIKALQDSPDQNQEDKSDGLRLSGSASDQLLQLAAQVRSTTLTPTQRTAAAARLVRMGKG